MRIHQLLDTPPVVITNEESRFVQSHPDQLAITSLQERELVIAQNLVRKGVYKISNDNNTLVKQGNETNKKTNLQ
jgi:hypothetical protein